MRFRRYKRKVKKLKFNKAKVYFFVIIIVFVVTFVLLISKAIPIIDTICEYKARSIALVVTNEAVLSNIKDITYSNLVELKKNEKGEIIAINANVMELNKLSTTISSDILDKLNNIEVKNINVPLTTIFEIPLASGFGPKIPFNVIPAGYVNSKFKSEFTEAGINQIRHRIYIEVTTNVRLIAPFRSSTKGYVNEITVAETIIVGDIPETYYNIEGMEGLDVKEGLNIID